MNSHAKLSKGPEKRWKRASVNVLTFDNGGRKRLDNMDMYSL